MKKKIRLLLKKINALAIIVALLAAAAPMGAAAADDNGLPEFYDSEDFGRAVWTTETQGSAVCYDGDGNAILCYGVQGGVFCAINIKTGEVIKEEALYSASQLGSMVTASDGCVYFNAYSQTGLTKYDPEENTISEVADSGFVREGGAMQSSFADTEGKVYFGDYNEDKGGGEVRIYDTSTNTTTNLGVIKEDAFYVQGVCADENYIYAGTGLNPNAAIVRIDKDTLEKTEFANNNYSTFRKMNIVNNYLVVKVSGGVAVYDLTTLTKKYAIGCDVSSAKSPTEDNVIYTYLDGEIKKHNLSTKTSSSVYTDIFSVLEALEESSDSTEADSEIKGPNSEDVEIAGLNWVEIDDDYWVLEFHSVNMEYVGYYNPNTNGIFAKKTSKIAETGPQVDSLGVSPDNVVYIGGYQTGMTAYNIDNEKFDFILPIWEQNTDVGYLNGKVYFGVYTDARIWRYDPEKPWNYSLYNGDKNYQGHDANPAMVYDIEAEQDRPMVVKAYKDKLYIGTTPGYQKLGGALTIYEEAEDGTPSAKTYRNLDSEQTLDGIIPGQSITGIAVKDNLVYLSGTIRGGKGINPVETEAKMAVFDTNTETFVVEPFVPDLPVEGSTTIGEISFGPDGLLWGCTEKEGLLFAMNPENFDVEKYVKIYPDDGDDDTNEDDLGALIRPLYIRWGDDGNIYTTAAWGVYVVDPETLKYKRITPNCSLMDIDNDGNVWFGKGHNFYRRRINQYDRFNGFIESIEDLEADDYFEKEYNELISEYNNAKSIINANSSDAMIMQTIDTLKSKMNKLMRIEDYITDVSVSFDYVKQIINIQASVPGDSQIAVKIEAPDGSTVMYDQVEIKSDTFSRAYRIDTIQEGEYAIYIHGFDADFSFTYYADAVLPEDTLVATSSLLEYDEILSRVEVSNYFSEPKQVSIIIGIYEELNGVKSLTGTEKIDVDINSGEHIYNESKKETTSDLIGKRLRLFVWEKDALMPLTPYKSLIVQGE